MSEPLHIGFELTENEFLRAHRLHLRRSLLTFRNLVALTFALTLGALQVALFGSEQWALRVFALLWLAVLLFAAYAFLLLPLRLYRRDPRHSARQEGVLSDEGIRLRQGTSEVLHEWSGISRTFENAEFFLLVPHGGLPIAVPKRALGSVEVTRFRGFLEADVFVP
ncbi:MAG: YcxB family protein [Oligoflexia bacterium]|nr:YcxB family protein [Oligoflexia bacterium]